MNYPQYAMISEYHLKAYRAFINMHSRCYNPVLPDYKNYGGRGIRVEGTWNLPGREGFNCFIADIGLPPDFHASLDRIDVNKSYSKNNCRWATRSEQALNKRPRQYAYSYVISYDKKKKKYKLYHCNLDIKIKTYIGWYDTLKQAEDVIKERNK